MNQPIQARTLYNVLVVNEAPPLMFLSRSQFEARLGLRPGGLAGATLPPPDAIIGPVNEDGSLPRGTTRGWLPETVDYWKRTRLGQGFRSDVRPQPQAVRPPRLTVEHNRAVPVPKRRTPSVGPFLHWERDASSNRKGEPCRFLSRTTLSGSFRGCARF